MTDATTETQTNNTTDSTAQATGLTVQDLTLVLQFIQVSSSRGTFKADEMSAIGGLYDRIFKFLEATGAITTQPPSAPPATPIATVTETVASSTKPAAKAAAKKSKGN